MAVTYTNAVKVARMDAVITLIDVGAGSELVIMEADTTVVANIPLADPSAPGAADAGVITFTATNMSDTNAPASGTAAIAEINDGDGLTVISGLTVGVAAEDIVLDSVDITAGQTVTITSATITHA
jgi:hypothetical protein